jgi:hypothetical protein
VEIGAPGAAGPLALQTATVDLQYEPAPAPTPLQRTEVSIARGLPAKKHSAIHSLAFLVNLVHVPLFLNFMKKYHLLVKLIKYSLQQ